MNPKGRPLSEIGQVPYYHRSFPFIPWTMRSKIRVSWVFARHLLRQIGPLRFAGFWLVLPVRLIPVYRKYREGFRMMDKKFGFMAGMEWILLVIIYREIERKQGAESAYLYAKEAIQDASKFMMNEFYQADRLAEFADPFEAFWSYHKAMFQHDPNFPNEMIEERDLKIMVVHECSNCQIARMTIPELAPIGCDHDITGYKAIEEKVQMEFRRPQTLAKDGKPCRFMFYRKGTASQDNSEVY